MVKASLWYTLTYKLKVVLLVGTQLSYGLIVFAILFMLSKVNNNCKENPLWSQNRKISLFYNFTSLLILTFVSKENKRQWMWIQPQNKPLSSLFFIYAKQKKGPKPLLAWHHNDHRTITDSYFLCFHL